MIGAWVGCRLCGKGSLTPSVWNNPILYQITWEAGNTDSCCCQVHHWPTRISGALLPDLASWLHSALRIPGAHPRVICWDGDAFSILLSENHHVVPRRKNTGPSYIAFWMSHFLRIFRYMRAHRCFWRKLQKDWVSEASSPLSDKTSGETEAKATLSLSPSALFYCIPNFSSTAIKLLVPEWNERNN